MDLVKSCIPNKEVTIRPGDKPWCGSEIRKFSKLRNRIKSKPIKSSNESDWTKYKHLRNKVHNLKKHAKEVFFIIISNCLPWILTVITKKISGRSSAIL